MKDKVSNKEFAWYIAAGIIAAFGIVLMVFGILGSYMVYPNFVTIAEASVNAKLKSNLGFRFWGLIFFALGAVVAVITLAVNSKKTDREVDRQLRRQRANVNTAAISGVKQAVEVMEEPAVDVQPAPAPEAK